MSSKEQIEQEMKDLTKKFWVALNTRNFDEVYLVQKQMKRLEALMRIEEDEDDIKPNPAIPESEMLNFLKRIKKN